MGYFGNYSYGTKKQKITEAFREFQKEGQYRDKTMQVKEAKKTCFGSHFWGVVCKGDKPLYYTKDEWICKPITEMEGPAYYDCPKKLLKLCPIPDKKFAKEWRDSCYSGVK